MCLEESWKQEVEERVGREAEACPGIKTICVLEKHLWNVLFPQDKTSHMILSCQMTWSDFCLGKIASVVILSGYLFIAEKEPPDIVALNNSFLLCLFDKKYGQFSPGLFCWISLLLVKYGLVDGHMCGPLVWVPGLSSFSIWSQGLSTWSLPLRVDGLLGARGSKNSFSVKVTHAFIIVLIRPFIANTYCTVVKSVQLKAVTFKLDNCSYNIYVFMKEQGYKREIMNI